MKKIIKKYRILIIIISILLFFLIVVGLFAKINSDGMENAGITKIKYRVYTKKDGWSKWSKSGITAGDLKNPITKIEIKLNDGDDIVYSYYTEENEWSEMITSSQNISDEENNIKAIKFSLFYNMSLKSEICYRTYNEENEWLDWTCNDDISGNIDEDVLGLQVKIIPRNIIKSDYLRDYGTNKINVGF